MHCRLALPSVPAAASQARRYVTESCGHLPGHAVDDALLITSELVTNAFKHGQPDIVLTLDVDAHCLHVEVEDGDPAIPERSRAPTDGEAGRGLALVDALSDAWGATPFPPGKRVWFDLSWP